MQSLSRAKIMGHIYLIQMQRWKRFMLFPYLDRPNTHIHVVSSVQDIPLPATDDTQILVFGLPSPEIETFADKHHIPIWQAEDGFIRSCGLGAHLTFPLSLNLDPVGIYFDTARPSHLENILEHHVFTPDEIALAQQVHQALLENNINKYNIGNDSFSLPKQAAGKTVILIVGQVEDDKSIRYGTEHIFTNQKLLETVRQNNPDAFIIYKIHPDVLFQERMGKIQDDAVQLADLIVENTNINAIFPDIDELHTMTSTSGFEALLHGKKVVCYGRPWYSNWGLTSDYIPIPRHTRKLTLHELIAGALILYPTYVDTSGQHTDILTVIDIIKKQKETSVSKTKKQRLWDKRIVQISQLLHFVKSSKNPWHKLIQLIHLLYRK